MFYTYTPSIYNPQSARTDTHAMQIRVEAQSLMCKGGVRADLPSYDDAVRIIGEHKIAQAA